MNRKRVWHNHQRRYQSHLPIGLRTCVKVTASAPKLDLQSSRWRRDEVIHCGLVRDRTQFYGATKKDHKMGHLFKVIRRSETVLHDFHRTGSLATGLFRRGVLIADGWNFYGQTLLGRSDCEPF